MRILHDVGGCEKPKMAAITSYTDTVISVINIIILAIDRGEVTGPARPEYSFRHSGPLYVARYSTSSICDGRNAIALL